ncbi:hypothetical protein Tdes44962_MAKER09629 [Teratosphaeria destructans]|uniref:Uncharacterized protein n=1 Tax=Teratosphaeria destructans TaxID=418781 RepID=A0A9W7W2J5_9PEZI|nr:hypothetical protein Tdes44962_MAKER09629 [Teratosphaeria destructans]
MNRRLEVLHGLPPLLARWVDGRWEFAVDWSQDPMFDLEVDTVCGREYRRVSIECARDGCDDRMIELCLWSLLKAEQENWRWLGGAAPGALVNGAAPGVPGQVPAQQAPACRLLGS